MNLQRYLVMGGLLFWMSLSLLLLFSIEVASAASMEERRPVLGDVLSSTPSLTKTITLAKPATLLPVPPVDISISKFVLGEIDFNQSFTSLNRICFHFLFSPDDPVDPNEAVSFIGAPGLDGAGFMNSSNSPRYAYSRCFTSDYTTRLFVDGQEYFGVRMDHGFGADPEGTTIIDSIQVEVEAVVYALYLPIVTK